MGRHQEVAGSDLVGAVEVLLPNSTPQTTNYKMQAYLDLSAMAAGDQYRIRVYEKVNAGTQRVLYEAWVSGAQSQIWVLPPFYVRDGWNIGLLKIAGTDRTIPWSLRLEESELVVALVDEGGIDSDSFDTGAITADAIAADAGTELAAAIWAFAHEAGRTAKGVLVRLDALMTGKHTGLLGALWTAFRADGSTKAIEATQDVAAGTRETASTIGGD